MRMKRKTGAAGRLAFLLALCMLVGLIGAAGAAGEEVSLTVAPPDNFADEAARADFDAAGVVVDLYLVAEATKIEGYDAYEYAPTGSFASLTLSDDMDEAASQALAQDAAAIAKDGATPVVTGAPLEQKITSGDDGSDLAAGIYLVIPRGGDEDYWTTAGEDDSLIGMRASSGSIEYVFTPLLIALPTKEDVNGDGVISSADEDGDWICDADLTLKFSMTEQFVEITVEKTIEDFEGEQASFVFLVEAVSNGETVFSETVMITMGASGTGTATMDRIPAGSDVTVTEIYGGPRYDAVGSDSSTIEAITADGDNVFAFTASKTISPIPQTAAAGSWSSGKGGRRR